MLPVRVARRDHNETEIVRALSRFATVWLIHEPGDLLVLFRSSWFVLEVKSAKGRLTPAQRASRQLAGPDAIPVVRTIEEALAAIGALR